MKVMLFDKAYNMYVNPAYPCRECILKETKTCPKMPTILCIEYGGFASFDKNDLHYEIEN